MARALVIGGGIAGLGSALFLQNLGHEVTLVEKANQVGALVRGFSRAGLIFETGFHYAGGLGKGGALHHYLDRLGLFKHGLQPVPLAPDGGELLRFADGGPDILVPSKFEDLLSSVPGGPEVDNFFKSSKAVNASSPYLNPGLSMDDIGARVHSNYGATLGDMLSSLPLEPRFKTLLGFRSLLYGAKPVEASFSDFSLVNTSYLNGAHTFDGGGVALVKAFEAELLASKIKVLTGYQATAIKLSASNAVRAVELQDAHGARQEMDVDMCIHTASPSILPQLLPPGAIRPVLARRLTTFKQTPSPFMFFGRTKSAGLAQRQLFLGPNDRLESWFAAGSKSLYASGGPGHGGYWPIYATSVLSEGDMKSYADLSPDGGRSSAYLELKEQLAEGMRLRLLKYCPELNGSLEVVASATDLTLNRYISNFGSGIFGKLHSVNEAPIAPITRVSGLALAGQNVLLPGILGALVSSAVGVGCLVGQREVLEILS